jgi:subtilisin family serine protease
MSYYIDPWRYNCAANAADSPAAQLEQQTIVEATQRALDYAHSKGVALVGSAGNEHEDLGYPLVDTTSPDFPPAPPNPAYPRNIDNHCIILPTEGNNVMSISAIGPSKRKADYSNYGLEQTTVAAPGGFFRDDPLWKATDPVAVRNLAGIPNQILAAYPKNVAEENGDLNPDGTPNDPAVVRDCRGSTCAYYQWIQGTSMASPHAVGVSALIVSRFGEEKHDNARLNPLITQAILQATATDTPCPEPRLHSYADKLRAPSFDALCEGTPELNGFYGHGIIDALTAVTADMDLDD